MNTIGKLAQLVQSISFTPRGSGVRIPHFPQEKGFQFEGLFLFSDMPFYVYIIRSIKNDKYYIGQTNNLSDRLKRHNAGYEKFTSSYLPWELCIYLKKPTRSEAMRLERKLKNLSRERIEKFIVKYGGQDEPSISPDCPRC